MKHFYTLSAFVLCLCLFVAPIVIAQEQENYNYNDNEFKEEYVGSRVIDDYKRPDLYKLSKLYWVLGELDMSNREHIDGYLLINECEIYKKFYTNEFEWSKIQDITRGLIKKNLSSFGTKIDIVRPIALGRYNMEQEFFEIDPKTSLRRAKNLEVYENARQRICGGEPDIAGYPRNLIVTLTRPLEMERLSVSRKLAKLYMQEVDKVFDGYSYDSYLENYERKAYVRLKVNVIRSLGVVYDKVSEPKMHVTAELDGIEVYFDKELTKPLFLENLKGKRRLLRKRK